MANVGTMELDDNLVNGQTYTFIFLLQNLVTLPSEQTIQTDIVNYAPDFLQSVQVTKRPQLFGFLTTYYDVQFTYEGDGSDVVSDLGQQLVAAFSAGSNDNFTFQLAIGSPASALPSTAVQQAGTVLKEASGQVGEAAGGTLQNALQGITTGLGAWFIPVMLLLAVVLIFQLGGISGIRRQLA
jgi:hypothetical protein